MDTGILRTAVKMAIWNAEVTPSDANNWVCFLRPRVTSPAVWRQVCRLIHDAHINAETRRGMRRLSIAEDIARANVAYREAHAGEEYTEQQQADDAAYLESTSERFARMHENVYWRAFGGKNPLA
jgi:hypothetical protein